MSALVYGLVRAAETSWGDAVALGSFALAALMLAAFVAIERRARQPITPLRLFASRERVGAYAARLLMVGAMFGMFFYLTQFLQGAEGFSALKAGLAFLPVTLTHLRDGESGAAAARPDRPAPHPGRRPRPRPGRPPLAEPDLDHHRLLDSGSRSRWR